MKAVFATFAVFVCAVLAAAGAYAWGVDVVEAPQAEMGMMPQVPSENPVSILAFGDMMLDRNVRLKIEANGAEYPFLLIEDFLKGHDIVAANAEGVFTDNQSVTAGVKNGPLVFTFDPATLPTIKNLGFTTLSQANNHSLNFGVVGLRESEKNIEAAGLDWFGDPSNVGATPLVKDIRGTKVAFVGYHQFAAGGMDAVLAAIRDAAGQGAFTIVYPHWGIEYEQTATDLQKEYAHAFIDAGADAVIGAHPHVIEPVEIYKDKAIFYSLGNFIFDQWAGPTSEGLAIGIRIGADKTQYALYPISIKGQQASVMSDPDRTRVLAGLADRSGLLPGYDQGVRDGSFKLPRK